MPFRKASVMDQKREVVEFAGRTFGSFASVWGSVRLPDTGCLSAAGTVAEFRSAFVRERFVTPWLQFKS